MDEFSSLIGLPFKLGNLITEESAFSSCVVDGIFIEPSMTKLPLVPVSLETKNPSFSVPQIGVIIKIEPNCDMSKDGEDDILNLMSSSEKSESRLIFSNQETMGKDPTAVAGGPLAGNIDSQYSKNVTNTLCLEDCLDLETNEGVTVREPKRTLSTSILEVSEETKLAKQNLLFNFPPLWGMTSMCGRRLEMEDSVVALPRFLEIPSQMLSESPLVRSVHKDLIGHVFGVYDGHGGCQVSNYCQERLHLALVEQIGIAKENLNVEVGEDNLREQWLDVFRKCFRRLDDEVGGFTSNSPLTPIAPDSVGSTAVVAVVCATHIIVANCGDSRAVLNRGKVPMPLSVDHKPNREDEYARIEAAGGKVINWDGYRVSGVLAVSRSIGDRYLRPYVVADPEIMFVPRTKEDECLILASDGLWDVMTNEEACDLARKRILIWHKKNGPTLSKERGNDIDPASQDAADYLSQLAFQRGSRDNISVIVIDLKAQRKFKKKA